MSSNLTGLPPSAIARLNAVANIQAISVKLISLPAGLQNNTSPVKIEGTVAGQNPDGSLQVQTEKGIVNILLKDRSPLPQGMRLEIDIPAGRNPQQASIRSAAEQTPAASSASQQAPSLAQTLAQQAATQPKLERATTLKATAIEEALRAASPKLADMVAAMKAPPAPLQAGQSMRLIPLPGGIAQMPALPQEALLAALTTLIEKLPADQAALKAQLTTLLSRMNLSSLEVPSQNGKAPPSLPPQIQQLLQTLDPAQKAPISAQPQIQIRYEPTQQFGLTKPVDVQVLGLMTAPLRPAGQPVQPLPAQIQVQIPQGVISAPTVPAQVLPAQVIGFTETSLPVVSLPNPSGGPALTYIAQFPAGNLQVGSPLLVTVLPESHGQLIPGQTMPTTPLSTWMQPALWDSLTDLIQNVHQINPGIAHTLTQILPQPAQSQNMGGLAMFFLSAMRSGDIESWMSPQIANLLRLTGKTDALRALTSDIALTARAENTVLAQDWRATMFPIYHDQHVHKVPVYYRHQHEADGEDNKERRQKLMRFLFDLKLARMGNVQIDGFMQPQRLDMIMRTKSPLSVPMQRNMQSLYAKAMDKSQLSGELTFQFKPEQWVSIDMPVTKEEMGVSA